MRSANSVEILCHLVYIILSCFTGAVRRPLRATGYLFDLGCIVSSPACIGLHRILSEFSLEYRTYTTLFPTFMILVPLLAALACSMRAW